MTRDQSLANHVCRVAKDSIKLGHRQTVLLTSAKDSDLARMALAAVMPRGSVCENSGDWVTPDGKFRITIKRYSDSIPSYGSPIALAVCNGGDALSNKDREHVQSWRKTVPTLGS